MSDEQDGFDRLVKTLDAKRTHLEASDKEWIRSNHPAAFRSGEWARILSVAPAFPEGRDCYIVKFPDGKTDWWVVDDPAAEYEFAETRPDA